MSNKTDFYQSLDKQLAALLTGNRNAITNLSQFSAFLNMHLEDINWAGFYLNQQDEELLLGPFQGKVACTNIPFGKGVCGTSASERATLVVEDVDQFDGHIACDAASRSEVVCPIVVEERLIGVLDIDSPSLKRFDNEDAKGLEKLVDTLITATDFD
ncbi:GAF domain-containing protein [Aliikangiella marina]